MQEGQFCKVFKIGKTKQLMMKYGFSHPDENDQTWPVLEFWTEYNGIQHMTYHMFRSEELKDREQKSWNAMYTIFDEFDDKEARKMYDHLVVLIKERVQELVNQGQHVTPFPKRSA